MVPINTFAITIGSGCALHSGRGITTEVVLLRPSSSLCRAVGLVPIAMCLRQSSPVGRGATWFQVFTLRRTMPIVNLSHGRAKTIGS